MPTQPPTADMPNSQKSSSGPVVGITIIVLLMAVGALYFWGARLNQQKPQDQLPLILPDDSTTTLQ